MGNRAELQQDTRRAGPMFFRECIGQDRKQWYLGLWNNEMNNETSFLKDSGFSSHFRPGVHDSR